MSEAGVLLDTSVLIDFLRQKDKSRTWFFSLAENDNRLAISILSHTELHSGQKIWENEKSRSELNNLLAGLEIIRLNLATSELGGQFRAKTGIDIADAVIAATALENNLPLATLNPKHFKKIPGLRLVKKVVN